MRKCRLIAGSYDTQVRSLKIEELRPSCPKSPATRWNKSQGAQIKGE